MESKDVFSVDHAYQNSQNYEILHVGVSIQIEDELLNMYIKTDHEIPKDDLEKIINDLETNHIQKMRLDIRKDFQIFLNSKGVLKLLEIQKENNQYCINNYES